MDRVIAELRPEKETEQEGEEQKKVSVEA